MELFSEFEVNKLASGIEKSIRLFPFRSQCDIFVCVSFAPNLDTDDVAMIVKVSAGNLPVALGPLFVLCEDIN